MFSTARLQYFWKEATSATNWTLNWTGSKSCSHSRSQNSLVFICLVIGSLLLNSSIINSAFSTLKNNSSSKVNESSKNPPVPSSCHVWASALSLHLQSAGEREQAPASSPLGTKRKEDHPRRQWPYAQLAVGTVEEENDPQTSATPSSTPNGPWADTTTQMDSVSWPPTKMALQP